MRPEIERELNETVSVEEDRIQDAYRRREQNDKRYSWFTPGHVFIMQRCERRILRLLHRCGIRELAGKTILEVGCGTGYWLREFVKWGAQSNKVTGIDLLPDRVSKAQQLCPPGVSIQCASAAQLPFCAASFDIVFQSTVFTSILDEGLKRRVAAEMVRVIKSDGLVLWYDYHVNNPRNPDVRGVKRREIHELFPNCKIHLERITLVPPLARALAPYSYLLCYLLEKVPLLCTHYLGIIRKNAS